MNASASLVPVDRIQNVIYLLRGQKILFDRDRAALYGVETRGLNQAVRRNKSRFPSDFLFSPSRSESRNLSQIVTCSDIKIRELMTDHSPIRSASREVGFHTIPRLKAPRIQAKKL